MYLALYREMSKQEMTDVASRHTDDCEVCWANFVSTEDSKITGTSAYSL